MNCTRLVLSLHTTGFVLTHPLPQPLGLPVPDFLGVDLLRRFPFPLALARPRSGFCGPHAYRDAVSATLPMRLHHRPLDLFFRVVPFDRAVFDLIPVVRREVKILARKRRSLARPKIPPSEQ